MKRFSLYLLLLLSPLAGSAQRPLFDRGRIAAKQYDIVLPFELVNNKIIVSIEAAGAQRRFILDTGAPLSLSSSLADVLRCPTIDSISVADQSGKTGYIDAITVPALSLGNVLFENTTALKLDADNPLLTCFGVDGLIGSNLLRNSVLQIDYRQSRVRITSSVKPLNINSKSGAKMDVGSWQSTPFIPLAYRRDGKLCTEKVMFDSGDDGLYMLSAKVYEAFFCQACCFEELALGVGTYTYGLHGMADEDVNYLVRVDTMKIGGGSFTNVLTKTVSADVSRIGAELLKYGVATLDFKRGRFYFAPYDNKTSITLNEGYWGFEPALEGEHLVVGIIWDKALLDVLSQGHKVLKFGGFDYSDISLCELLVQERKTEPDEATLVFQDRETDEIKTITLKKQY